MDRGGYANVQRLKGFLQRLKRVLRCLSQSPKHPTPRTVGLRVRRPGRAAHGALSWHLVWSLRTRLWQVVGADAHGSPQ